MQYYSIPNYRITVRPEGDYIWAFDWEVGSELTATVDDPGTVLSPDASQTVTVADWWAGFYFEGIIDIQAGFTISVSDEIATKTHIVTPLQITNVDQVAELVAGTADPGSLVDVGACDADCVDLYPITDSGGTWQANFSGSYDIVPGTTIYATQKDSDDDETSLYTIVPNPRLSVTPAYDYIVAYEWVSESELTTTVDDPGTIISPDASSTATADLNGAVVIYFDGIIDILPGFAISVSDGSMTKTHLVTSLEITGVDQVNEIVTGIAEADNSIDTHVCYSSCYDLTVTADGEGDWLANYAGNFDIVPGTRIYAYQFDDDGDWTRAYQRLPDKRFGAYPRVDEIHIDEWEPDTEITLELDDLGTIENPDASLSAMTNSSGQTIVSFSGIIDIQPGFNVSVYDGSTTKTHIVTSVEITDADVETEIINGTAEPDSLLYVEACDTSTWSCYQLEVYANSSGDWEANFSGLFDILPGNLINATQWDEDSDFTRYNYFVPWGDGIISGVVNAPDGNPVTGVQVLVEVYQKSDYLNVGFSYTDSSDGTFIVTGLPEDVELAVGASWEDPDADGYPGEFYDNTDVEFAVPIWLTAGDLEWDGVIINLDEHHDSVIEEHLTFNVRPGRILEDFNIRHAIAYGTNRLAILEGVFQPFGYEGVLLNAPVFPGNWFEASASDPLMTIYDFNQATANALLDAGGWIDEDADGIREKDGNELALDFKTTTAAVRTASGALFKSQMADIGILINEYYIPSSDFFSDDPAVSPLLSGDFDIVQFAWVLQEYDSLPGVYFTGNSQNYGGYSNAFLDAYFTAAKTAKENLDNAAFLDQALGWQSEFSADLPSLPLFTRVFSPSISGVVNAPDGNPVTGVEVQVDVYRKSDYSLVTTVFSDPADGTFKAAGLPTDEALEVCASNEDPDVDGYPGECYKNGGWTFSFILSFPNPVATGVVIDLDAERRSAPVEQLTFNTRPGRILEDATIRQAIAYGTDREAILHTIWEPAGTTGEILNAVMFPGVWFEAADDDPLLTVYSYDPTTARALLAGAGWVDVDADGIREKGGTELVLDFYTTTAVYRVATANFFKTQMADIGILVNVYPTGTFFEPDGPLYTGNFDIAEFAWIMYDYDYLLGVFNTDNFQNYGGYSNLMLDGYYLDAETGKAIDDDAAFLANALYWQYEFSADLPALPFFHRIPTPAITGTIYDSLDNPLTGMTVELRVLDSGETQISSWYSNPDDGTYRVPVPPNFSGSIVPVLSGYMFDPISRDYSAVMADIGGENYAAIPSYLLTITKTGTGAGWVGSSPGGISCGADCSESYAPGTSVKLTATASPGSAFTGWSGACGGMSTTCYVTMSKAKSVTANFTLNPAGQYFLSTVKVGSGSVLSTPAGISCPTDCGEFYNSGTSVKLVATASAGYVFTGWSGACGGTTATCFVPMSKNKTVTATFLAVPSGKYYLGVKKAGMGTVTSVSPAGTINCGTDCSEFYNAATVVRLHATPALGYTFTGWSGACGGTADCFVNMSNHKFVKATFTVIPGFRG